MTAPTRDERIDDMRKMLTWLKQHPEVPLPDFDVDYCILTNDDEDGLGHIATIASDLGVEPTSNLDGTHHYAKRPLGTARYRAFYVGRASTDRYYAERRHIAECMPPEPPTVDAQVVDEQPALTGAVTEDESRCPDPECGEPLAAIASGAVGHCGRSCVPVEAGAVSE